MPDADIEQLLRWHKDELPVDLNRYVGGVGLGLNPLARVALHVGWGCGEMAGRSGGWVVLKKNYM